MFYTASDSDPENRRPSPPLHSQRPSLIPPGWDPMAFFLHPRNMRFVTGESRRLVNYNAGAVVFIGGLFLLLGLSMWWSVQSNGDGMGDRGITTTAIVTDIFYGRRADNYTPNLRNNNPTGFDHFISFEFSSPRRPYLVTQEISPVTYDRLLDRKEVTIKYDRDNPENARLADDDADYDSVGGVLRCAVGISGLAAVAVIAGLMSMWRTIRLQRKAYLLKGTVVAINARRGRGSNLVVFLRYQVVSPTGEMLIRDGNATRNDLKHKELPPPGTPVYVAYVNDNLFRVL